MDQVVSRWPVSTVVSGSGSVTGWVGFAGGTENSLINSERPADHLELAGFSLASVSNFLMTSGVEF